MRIESDGQPDYPSNYFPQAAACHEVYSGAIQNPNRIAPQKQIVDFPLTSDMTAKTMKGSPVVGLALNGVAIFDNAAAPGDDIFTEAKTFDRCGGHPQMSGQYHYHGEPFALSYDDSGFIGVLRDGYQVFGRKDPDGSYPQLDAFGGHAGPTVDGTVVYHYHVNEQTSTGTATSGQKQWFLTNGNYRGTPAACGTCM